MTTLIEQANALWQARTTGGYCSPIESTLTLEQAYSIQHACTETAPSDDSVVGYKIGATADQTLSILGLDAPFFGPLYKQYLINHTSTAPLKLELFMQHKPRIEAEFVVCMKNDIKRGSEDITIDEVMQNIDWVAPGLEIVGSRFNNDTTQRGFKAIADFGGNQSMIVGNPYNNWRDLDLSSHPVTLNIEGEELIEGHSGISIYGHPVHFVAWLLNLPAMQKVGLKAGQFVSCGTCTGAPFLSVGKPTIANYGPLGQIELEVVEKLLKLPQM